LDSRTQAAVALEGTRFGGHRQAGWRATMIDRGKAVDYTRALGTMPNILREIADSAVALAKGFSVTFRTMLRPTVTENYPHEPAQIEDRYRGVHVLRRDENGMEKCVACFLCAAACPSNCIYIEGAENAAENRISAAERYAKVYNIDYNRCIFCGYCVEACPCDAITHGHEFEIAAYDTNALVYRKEQLLEPLPASATRK
jgi:NADH-quinone oxidoreductase subunit I